MTTGQVRFGTRIVLPDGTHTSFLEMAQEQGWKVTDTGYMVGMMKGEDGTVEERVFHFPYAYGGGRVAQTTDIQPISNRFCHWIKRPVVGAAAKKMKPTQWLKIMPGVGPISVLVMVAYYPLIEQFKRGRGTLSKRHG